MNPANARSIALVRERTTRLRAAEFAARAAENARLRAWLHQLADLYTKLSLRSEPRYNPRLAGGAR